MAATSASGSARKSRRWRLPMRPIPMQARRTRSLAPSTRRRDAAVARLAPTTAFKNARRGLMILLRRSRPRLPEDRMELHEDAIVVRVARMAFVAHRGGRRLRGRRQLAGLAEAVERPAFRRMLAVLDGDGQALHRPLEIAALVDGDLLRGLVDHEQEHRLFREPSGGGVGGVSLRLRVDVVEFTRAGLGFLRIAHPDVRADERPLLEALRPDEGAGLVVSRRGHFRIRRGNGGASAGVLLASVAAFDATR